MTGNGSCHSQGQADIGALDDDLLLRVFSNLRQKQSFKAALVCRKWHKMSLDQQLVSRLRLNNPHEGHSFLDGLESFLLWSMRHGSAVRHLRVDLMVGLLGDVETKQALAKLDMCLSIISPSLREMELDICIEDGDGIVIGAWTASATKLERLKLTSNMAVSMWGCMSPLTSLKSLHISAQELHLGDRVALPASLTYLELDIYRDENNQMPAQVGRLFNLQKLRLSSVSYSGESMDSLAGLHQLRKATFRHCRLPACLSQLTALEALTINAARTAGSELEVHINEALPGLTQLTGLEIAVHFEAPAIIPNSLTALRQLRRLTISQHMEPGLPTRLDLNAVLPSRLPASPWLHSLTELTVSVDVAQFSLDSLRAAQQLRSFRLTDCRSRTLTSLERLRPLWQWAAHHKPLQQFIVQTSSGGIIAELAAACLQLKVDRPHLHVQIVDLYAVHRQRVDPDDQY